MTGEECKLLHPVPCRNTCETPKKVAQHNAKATIHKYFRATRECYNDRCFRIHRKATRRKLTPPVTQEPSATPRTTYQQQAMIDTQNLAYNRPYHCYHSPPSIPPPLTLPRHQLITTPHPHTISHYPSDYRSTVPQSPPLPAIPYATSSSWTPTQSLHMPQTSTLAPQAHCPTFPHIVTQRSTTANDHIIFFYGRWCSRHCNIKCF